MFNTDRMLKMGVFCGQFYLCLLAQKAQITGQGQWCHVLHAACPKGRIALGLAIAPNGILLA